MSAYPTSDDERRVPEANLRRHTETIFARCGMSAPDAALLADTLVTADLRGVHSHGVLRIPEYVKKLTQTGADPKARPTIVKENPASAVIDAHNGMGQIAAHFAMEQAIAKARETSVAIATVRGSNHCGAMAYYAMQALPVDMIGIATTNALPTMAPWGGIDKVVGINPLAVAIPAAGESPLVLDAAFSASSHGKMRVFHQKGLPIPPTWAFDALGRPTTDADLALKGLLQPIGGYKGVALGMVMGILSSLLSSAGYGTESGNMIDGPKPGADGHFLMAIQIAAFESVPRFKARVDGIIREIHHSRAAEGVGRLLSPGEMEAETEVRYRREGIPLNDTTIADIETAVRGLKIEPLRF